MSGYRPTRVEVDLDAIGNNVRALLPAEGALMVVVKADAYGHGAVPVARAALAVAAIHDRVGGAGATAAAAAYVSGTTLGGAAGRLLAGPLAAVVGWRGALLAVTIVCALAAVAFVSPEVSQRRFPEHRARRRAAGGGVCDVEPVAPRPAWANSPQRFDPADLRHVTTQFQLKKPYPSVQLVNRPQRGRMSDDWHRGRAGQDNGCNDDRE